MTLKIFKYLNFKNYFKSKEQGKNTQEKNGQFKSTSTQKKTGPFLLLFWGVLLCFVLLFVSIYDSQVGPPNYFSTHSNTSTGGKNITQPLDPISPGASN